MERQTQPASDGGALGSPQPDGRPRVELERNLQRTGILSLDQIRAIRSCNNYTEGPTAAPRRAPPPRTAPRPEKPERTHEVVNINNNYEQRAPAHAGPQYGPGGPVLSRSGSSESGGSSASSERGLLGRHQPGRAVRTQPKAQAPPPSEEVLKPAGTWKGADCAAAGHRLVCERCGRCKCAECASPRTLPSCLACGGQCLCSAETVLEHATCMCLVKGLFYHCSNDDAGDSCADGPCSLSRSHCCSRFLCMGLMSLLFPCLLCYPPAKACVKACQHCYDRAARPGCRCRNSNAVYCKLEDWASPRAPGKPS